MIIERHCHVNGTHVFQVDEEHGTMLEEWLVANVGESSPETWRVLYSDFIHQAWLIFEDDDLAFKFKMRWG